ncbi:hypothetical protein GCM10022267_39780 [Lentzea roselyniae]|uniref:Tn3 transposase DDE domain-containing protein n=1 Tax=Lentzea roselyniae TaxID=531940 RepID=A0ABP7B5F4_9PSEU
MFGDVLAAAREATGPTDLGPEAQAVEAIEGDDSGAALEAGGQAADQAGRLMLKALEDGDGLEQLMAAHQAVAAHHGNNYLPLLEQFYRSHRPTLFTLVDSLQMEATSEERSVLDAVEFIKASRDRRGDWIEEVTTVKRDGQDLVVKVDVDSFASDLWRKALRDKRKPGMLARRHLEVCVFSALAAELRSGDIAVAGSDSYANLHAQLMGWDECQALVPQFCEQAGIPSDADKLVAFFKDKLAKAAKETDAGYPANTDLRLEGGKLVLARRKGQDRRPSAIALEQAIHQRLPERSLLDILARTAHLTGWHRHFGPASGSDPKIRDAMGRYVVTAYTYGGNLTAAEVARSMKGVSAHEIYTAGNKHCPPDKIHKASAEVINRFAELDVAGIWGDGHVVPADGSQIETWDNNLLAETSVRYGGFGGIAFRPAPARRTRWSRSLSECRAWLCWSASRVILRGIRHWLGGDPV